MHDRPGVPPLISHLRISASRTSSLAFAPLSTAHMVKKRKNRTHLKGGAASGAPSADTSGVPKSFVIKHGQVGSSLSQLVRDIRKVMEPNTASRLKVRLLFVLMHPIYYNEEKLTNCWKEGTYPEQAQGLFDHGPCTRRYSSPRVHACT